MIPQHQPSNSTSLSRSVGVLCVDDTKNNVSFMILPPEVRGMIYDQVLTSQKEQRLPLPLMQTSKRIKQEFLHSFRKLLNHRTTLQLVRLNHPIPQNTWDSFASGEFFHTPGLPTLSGHYLKWENFRESAEEVINILARVGCVYIRMPCYRGLAFTIRFNDNTSPSILIHQSRAGDWERFGTRGNRWALDIEQWTLTPAVCSTVWIDSFIASISDQCDRLVKQTT
ncbi:hypothetical protein E4T42_03541 [Aureobasidium subglaciale]|nr:hypothetical protein E4T42_03541 [Aureobasidium subglaciale]